MAQARRILSLVLCAVILIGMLPAGIAHAAEPENEKFVYNDFEAGLGTTYDGRTSTGNGANEAYVVNAEGDVDHRVGTLSLSLGNGGWLRTWNTATGLENYKYMVLRMKGSYSGWGGVLTGNALSFKFGSGGVQTPVIAMSVEQLTEDYSYVFVEIPDPQNFYNINASGYAYSLWIGSQRGARFDVDIDEIYFTNVDPNAEPEEPAAGKVIYNDFVAGLGGDYAQPTPTGNGDNTAYVVSAEAGAAWSVADGVLHLDITNGQWLRTWNSVTGLDNYKYMVVRIKGGYDWETLTGNSIAFKFGSGGAQSRVLYMTAEQLTKEYSNVAIEIPENFFNMNAGDYSYGLWIGTERGAKFNIDIDEIYFSNTLPSDEQGEEPGVTELEVPIDGTNVKFFGRTGGLDTSGRLVLEWINSGFSFNFTGTSFELTVAGANVESRMQPYIAYSVDGGAFTAVKVASSVSAIRVDGLTEGNHSVLVVRINEPINNPIYVVSLKIGSASGTPKMNTPDGAANTKILFIGDSLTTAYGNTGFGQHNYTTEEQDGTKGYAWLTAQHFDADAQYIAREGRGLVNNNYEGYTDYIGDILGVESFVLGTSYELSSWTPDIVVINVGSNDEEGKPNKTTQAQMTEAAKVFLARIRGLYPDARIIWAYDVLTPADGGAVRKGILEAIKALNDENVEFRSLTTVAGRGTYGHPDVDEHKLLAEDLIYYIENPNADENPETNPNEGVYSEFNTPLIEGVPVDNGAGGAITLVAIDGGTQSVHDGALYLDLNGEDKYIRFTGSLLLTDGISSNYKRMVIRIKGGASDANAEAVTGNMLKVIFGNWGNEGNALMLKGEQVGAGEYTDVVFELSDRNFANIDPNYATGLILRNVGNINTSVQIDRIVFTNPDEEPDPTNPPENPPVDPPAEGQHVYSEFTTPLIKGAPVDNGAGGTVTLFEMENASQAVSGGNLNLKLGDAGYIRFTSSMQITDGKNAKYKYIVIRLKGSGTRTDGTAVTGPLVNVIMCSWGNEANPVVISGSKINSSGYVTIALELSDKNFANTNADYLTGLILRNAGNYNTTLQIDRIYFTNTRPADAVSGNSGNSTGTQTKGKNVYSDFRHDLVEGKAVDSGAGGTITFFNEEGATHSVSNGALNVKFANEGGYIRFNSSLKLATDANTSLYKYMVIRMKGSATKADGSKVTGAVLKAVMGSWGNEANPLLIDASQLTDDYSVIALELSDKSFANTHADYRGGLILQSAGNYLVDISIDEIYFTDVKPADALEVSPGGEVTDDPIDGPDDGKEPAPDPTESVDPTEGSTGPGDENDNDGRNVTPSKNNMTPYIILSVLGAVVLGFGATVAVILAKRRKAQ